MTNETFLVFRYIMDSSLLSVAEQLLKDLQRTYSETNKGKFYAQAIG